MDHLPVCTSPPPYVYLTPPLCTYFNPPTGAQLDLPVSTGSTPLHFACLSGHAEVVRALLAAGAKASVLCHAGASPLFAACQGGSADVVRILLAASGLAQLDQQNKVWGKCSDGMHAHSMHGGGVVMVMRWDA